MTTSYNYYFERMMKNIEEELTQDTKFDPDRIHQLPPTKVGSLSLRVWNFFQTKWF